MISSLKIKHPRRMIAIMLGAAAAAVGIGLSLQPASVSDPVQAESAEPKEQNTYLMHDQDTLDSIVNVPKGTYLVVKSDQTDQDANVQVTGNGGFVVEEGAVLVLENVNLISDEKDRSTPVFSVYGNMVMNDGAVVNFTSTTEGSDSAYGKGGCPAICVVDGTFTMNDGLISGNSNTTTKEAAFGGALRAEGSDAAIIINNGTISGNSVLSSAAVTDDLTVTANALGGAIAVTEGASVTINGGEISGNTAGSHEANTAEADYQVCSGNGGAIAVYSSNSNAISSLYLDGGSIVNNNAYRTDGDETATVDAENQTYGGGIFSNIYTTAVLSAGTISGNTSDDVGGGTYFDSAKAYGGAIFRNTLISGNEAVVLGGGLWFCPNGQADMFSEALGDGIAIFDNLTARRGTDGAGDDIYVSPRNVDTGVTLTGTMPGGGTNAWYEDGGAATWGTSDSSTRYTSSDAAASDDLLQASAIVNMPTAEARNEAVKSATVVVTGNHAAYGGGIASNHYLRFGTPTTEEEEDHDIPHETPEPEKISINVNKIWVGDAGTEATVHLLANGTEVTSATLNADNNWTYTFTDLAQKDSNGNKIIYTLTEDAVDGYESSITGDAGTGFTVTNTKETTPAEKISIDVNKVWVGGEEEAATVHLLANGTETASAVLTADDDWSYTFTDLDQTDSDGNIIIYTLTEDTVDGYQSSITGNAGSGFTVTNTKNEPAKTSVTVTKVWVGDAGESATVHLFANGTEVDSLVLKADNSWTDTFENLDQADSEGNEITYTLTEDTIDGYASEVSGDAENGFTVTNTKQIDIQVNKVWIGDAGESATVHLFANGTEVDSLVLKADNSWTDTFEDLDQVDSSGNEITYTLTEDTIDGYSSEISGDADTGFIVTNTELTSVSVSKEWIGPEGDSATVRVLADGTEVANATLTATEDWTHTFKDLPKYDSTGAEIEYTVTEDEVDGYDSTVADNEDGSFTVTNTSNAKVGVRVIKDWRGMPEAVTVNLYGQAGTDDAALVESVTLDGEAETLSSDSETGVEYGEDDAWVAVFTGLPKYDSETGSEITYSVTEDAVSETSSVIGEPVTEGDVITFTITNTRAATFQPTVTKEWDEGVTS